MVVISFIIVLREFYCIRCFTYMIYLSFRRQVHIFFVYLSKTYFFVCIRKIIISQPSGEIKSVQSCGSSCTYLHSTNMDICKTMLVISEYYKNKICVKSCSATRPNIKENHIRVYKLSVL